MNYIFLSWVTLCVIYSYNKKFHFNFVAPNRYISYTSKILIKINVTEKVINTTDTEKFFELL